jgi:hypothetical protein
MLLVPLRRLLLTIGFILHTLFMVLLLAVSLLVALTYRTYLVLDRLKNNLSLTQIGFLLVLIMLKLSFGFFVG